MFDLLAVRDVRGRIDALGQFLEFWYGPRRKTYGEPARRLAQKSLPESLRRFYALAGRWPPAFPDRDLTFFYTGAGGHHLDGLKAQPDGRLNFFMEYQGEWDGLTLPNGQDPPVWIQGSWEDEETDDEVNEGVKTRQVSDSLSRFLVTHCLMTTLYEWDNCPYPDFSSDRSEKKLARWFQSEQSRAILLWEAEARGCPNYEGSFYLFHKHVLVHRGRGSFHRFGALHAEGIALLKQHLGKDS